MGNFFYPRTISVLRQATNTTAGAQGYSGVTPENEETIFTNVAAHIEAERIGNNSPANLPANSQGEPIYLIIFILPLNSVQNRDIIIDDTGYRYQVISADWGPMVTTCRSKKLEN